MSRPLVPPPASSSPPSSTGSTGWFGDRGYFGASSEWLANINLILALFNLLPGYPLDGGRILESIVWGFTRKQETGVKVAGTAGQIIAYGLIAFGGYRAFQGDVFGGIWIGHHRLYPA